MRYASSALPWAFAATLLAQSETKPIAIHTHEIDGVSIALMEVSRSNDIVTVKWEYRNKTKAQQVLASVSRGWSDPYRLSWDSYLADEKGHTKFPLLRDSGGYPVAAKHGQPVQEIVVGPEKTLKTWAKYSVPPDVTTVSVFLNGTDPFESISIANRPADQK